jgi:hypothetical protein
VHEDYEGGVSVEGSEDERVLEIYAVYGESRWVGEAGEVGADPERVFGVVV